jgi:hypothetical protein
MLAHPDRAEDRRNDPPSSYALVDLLEGRPGALARTVGLTAVRAGLIAPGLYVAGVRERLAVKSLAASTSITLFLLAWYAVKR